MSTMKDATVIAREIQDMATAMSESMANFGEVVKGAAVAATAQPRNSEAPLLRLEAPAPVINLPPPQIDVQINVPEQPAPTVNIAPAAVTVHSPVSVQIPAVDPVAYQVEVTERDKDGMIKTFLVMPVRIEG